MEKIAVLRKTPQFREVDGTHLVRSDEIYSLHMTDHVA